MPTLDDQSRDHWACVRAVPEGTHSNVPYGKVHSLSRMPCTENGINVNEIFAHDQWFKEGVMALFPRWVISGSCLPPVQLRVRSGSGPYFPSLIQTSLSRRLIPQKLYLPKSTHSEATFRRGTEATLWKREESKAGKSCRQHIVNWKAAGVEVYRSDTKNGPQ